MVIRRVCSGRVEFTTPWLRFLGRISLCFPSIGRIFQSKSNQFLSFANISGLCIPCFIQSHVLFVLFLFYHKSKELKMKKKDLHLNVHMYCPCYKSWVICFMSYFDRVYLLNGICSLYVSICSMLLLKLCQCCYFILKSTVQVKVIILLVTFYFSILWWSLYFNHQGS